MRLALAQSHLRLVLLTQPMTLAREYWRPPGLPLGLPLQVSNLPVVLSRLLSVLGLCGPSIWLARGQRFLSLEEYVLLGIVHQEQQQGHWLAISSGTNRPVEWRLTISLVVGVQPEAHLPPL